MIPDSVLQAKGPENTVTVDTGSKSPGRCHVRERLSYRMTANGTPGPRKGKITGYIIDNACAAKEDLTVTVSVDGFWNLPADVRSLDILLKLGLATATKDSPAAAKTCTSRRRKTTSPVA